MIQGSAADSRSAATRLIVAENPRLAEIAAEFLPQRAAILSRSGGNAYESRELSQPRPGVHAPGAGRRRFPPQTLLLGMAETGSVLAQSAEAMESYVDAREALGAH